MAEAPVSVDKRIDECNHHNTNDKEQIDPKNASSLVIPEHVDARVNTSLQNLHSDPGPPITLESIGPEFNTYGENNDEFERYNSRKRKSRCYNCGARDHEGKLCRKVTECFICSKKGHLVLDCPKKNVGVDFTSRQCLKCGGTGHDMFSCSNKYDPEDLKDIECYVCRKVGHLCCVEDNTEGQTEPSCYKCGQWGHFASECTLPNEVPGSFCNKCKIRGHYNQHCPKKARTTSEKAAARKTKWRTQRARKRLKNTTKSTPVVNKEYHNQPKNGCSRPPTVEPHYGHGISNFQPEPLPSHRLGTQLFSYVGPLTRIVQNVYSNTHNGPQIPQIPLNQEPQTMVRSLSGSEIRRPPVVQLPIPNVNHQMEYRKLHLTGSEIMRPPVIQRPIPNVNHQMEYRNRVPYLTGSEIMRPPVVQLPIPNVNHQMEYRNRVVPHLTGSEIRRPPVIQRPIPNVNHQMEYRTRAPHLTGSEIRRPPVVQHPVSNVNVSHQRDSRVPLNYTSQFPHAVQNNPRQPLIPQTVIRNPQQYLTPETGAPRPYFGWTFRSSF